MNLTHIRSTLLAFVLGCVSIPAFAQTADLKLAAQQRFENKILLIKGWYQDDHLKYDSAGNVSGNAKPGAWTTSGLQIHSVSLHKDGIRLRGARIVWQYDRGKRKLTPERFGRGDDVDVTIEHQPTPITVPDLERLENAIFVRIPAVRDVPEYWRDFLVRGEKDSGKATKDKPPADLPEIVEGLFSNGGPVYRVVGPHITPPRLLKHKEPEYSELARHAHIEGTNVLSGVVDEQGVLSQIQILRPIGVGLDEEAVKAVSRWHFEPAKRDGKPVPVAIEIEVSFRLR